VHNGQRLLVVVDYLGPSIDLVNIHTVYKYVTGHQEASEGELEEGQIVVTGDTVSISAGRIRCTQTGPARTACSNARATASSVSAAAAGQQAPPATVPAGEMVLVSHFGVDKDDSQDQQIGHNSHK